MITFTSVDADEEHHDGHHDRSSPFRSFPTSRKIAIAHDSFGRLIGFVFTFDLDFAYVNTLDWTSHIAFTLDLHVKLSSTRTSSTKTSHTDSRTTTTSLNDISTMIIYNNETKDFDIKLIILYMINYLEFKELTPHN